MGVAARTGGVLRGGEQRELDRFAARVVSRLGLRIDEHNEAQVCQVLHQRLERSRCATVDDYTARFDAEGRFAQHELREIAIELTVHETFFFRHAEQFQALSEVALPARLKAGEGTCPLRILSAGCASGEEAYSLAATVARFPSIQNRTVCVYGLDINTQLLRKARRARYSEWSLRAVPQSRRGQHFRLEGKEYVLDPALKSLVCFEERNLLDEDPSFWRPDFFDVIFCRNVLIYLDPVPTRTVIDRFTRSLAPGGFLFLGPSETLRGISENFHLRHTHEAFYYQRLLPDEKPRSAGIFESKSATGISHPGNRESDPGRLCAEPAEGAGRQDACGPSAGRMSALPATRGAVEPEAPVESVSPCIQHLSEIRKLVGQERFAEALRAIDALPQETTADPDATLLEAVILAHKGELGPAEEACRRLLLTDGLRPGAHYVMAVCQERRGDLLSAAEHDQTAIYLDPAFSMPRLHLGLVAKRLGDLTTARRELREALTLLAREDASRILLFGGGFSREALVRFCQAQYDRCGGAQ